jgi:hypothetical protein
MYIYYDRCILYYSHPFHKFFFSVLGTRTRAARLHVWLKRDICLLMEVFSACYVKENGHVNWRHCYRRMRKVGLERTMSHCQAKVKNLRVSFIRVHNQYNPQQLALYASDCPYWESMCRAWGKHVMYQDF